MDKAIRNAIERATQQARKLLDDDFSSQLEGTFDVLRSGVIAATGGTHLSALQQSQRRKIVAAIEHKRASGMNAVDAVTDYVRDAAFTTLNRFVALKMLEARELVQDCITSGEQSLGYREFCGMAPGIALLPNAAGYRLYIECLFDEFSTEIKVLFDRRDTASVLWPKRQAFETLLELLNTQELSDVWGDDETIGWVYQFFNSSEERRQMREKSQAPRNGRELAVRNQFFTPRYVVQFLTDNTLGRLWFQMYGDRTQLNTICDYLVCSFNEPNQGRQRKDPRDIRVLDPACGSGHFLLYSFDLFLTIYEEAWSVREGAPRSESTGQTLCDDYPDLDSLRRAAPKLVVEQNLFGIDIDPRCAQIAALAQWLRAQRAWKEMGVTATERPRIHRTHIVVAEPIPGDAVLVDEFAARLEPPLLRDLFRQIVSQSRLAGDLGALIRIEDGIAAELKTAREQFISQRQAHSFLPGMEPTPKQGALDFSGIDDDSFFHEAEARILESLRGFAEAAVGSAGVRRLLFAGDATQGVALIDILRTKFDVVLMNPPFGSGSLAAKKEFEKSYPRTKNDVFAAFVERGVQLLNTNGLLGAITSRTGFFLPTFQKWREEILLKEALPVLFADLGHGVLDSAMVEVAAYCLEKNKRGTETESVFMRVLDEGDKAAALKRVLRKGSDAQNERRFELHASSFEAIPRSPFAYWISDRLRRLFEEFLPFEAEGRSATVGIQSSDDFRFLRLWWEVEDESGFVGNAKGGQFSRYYSDVFLMVSWNDDGREIKAFAEVTPGSNHWSRNIRSADQYFRPGLTWSHRTTSGLSLRVMPAGCIFGSKGPAVLVENDDFEKLLAILAITNSRAFASCVELQLAAADAAARSYDVGVIQRTPFPSLHISTQAALSALGRRAWSLKRQADVSVETSHSFYLPALLQMSGDTLASRAAAWIKHIRSIETDLSAIQTEIETKCFELYGIEEAERCRTTEGFGNCDDFSNDELSSDGDIAEYDDQDESGNNQDLSFLAADLVSWAVGVAFGRFAAQPSTGSNRPPSEPEPFHPLPKCSPAMLTSDEGVPLRSAPPNYAINFPANGILVDDPGHANDLTSAVRYVLDKVCDLDSDAFRNELGTLLDPRSQELRAWLAASFFEHHLKRHSKSRRKAPINWQLAVPSGRYSMWLYAQRLTADSFFQIQNDFVVPKLAHEERHLTSLIESAGANPSANERKEIASQEAFIGELRVLLEEVKRIAPMWKPRLGDGVVLTMAPLWRLVPRHKSWQKELKSKWDELAGGQYDWAHIAMHLWPERVIPKCWTDRSLAVAHGLEDTFWVLGDFGKWNARPIPERPVEELVQQRNSIAVKAALKSLLGAAPTTSNGGRRPRGPSANRMANGGIR